MSSILRCFYSITLLTPFRALVAELSDKSQFAPCLTSTASASSTAAIPRSCGSRSAGARRTRRWSTRSSSPTPPGGSLGTPSRSCRASSARPRPQRTQHARSSSWTRRRGCSTVSRRSALRSRPQQELRRPPSSTRGDTSRQSPTWSTSMLRCVPTRRSCGRGRQGCTPRHGGSSTPVWRRRAARACGGRRGGACC